LLAKETALNFNFIQQGNNMEVSRNVKKSILALSALFILPTTAVYAERDLNSLLKGTYAQNEQWTCQNSYVPFQLNCPDCWTTQSTAAGKITYNGDGTAQSEGNYSYTNHTEVDIDFGTYSCDWIYTVNEDRSFNTEGDCVITSTIKEQPPVIFTNQKWYGQISKWKKNIVVERHDAEIEGISIDGGVTNVIDSMCGKTGAQTKVRRQK